MGRLSESPELTPGQRETAALAEMVANYLERCGGHVWGIGYDFTAETAEIGVDAPDGTVLECRLRVIKRRLDHSGNARGNGAE